MHQVLYISNSYYIFKEYLCHIYNWIRNLRIMITGGYFGKTEVLHNDFFFFFKISFYLVTYFIKNDNP